VSDARLCGSSVEPCAGRAVSGELRLDVSAVAPARSATPLATVVTAAITSTFVEAARRRAAAASERAEADAADHLQIAMTAMAGRLDEIEGLLRTLVEQTRRPV